MVVVVCIYLHACKDPNLLLPFAFCASKMMLSIILSYGTNTFSIEYSIMLAHIYNVCHCSWLQLVCAIYIIYIVVRFIQPLVQIFHLIAQVVLSFSATCAGGMF